MAVEVDEEIDVGLASASSAGRGVGSGRSTSGSFLAVVRVRETRRFVLVREYMAGGVKVSTIGASTLPTNIVACSSSSSASLSLSSSPTLKKLRRPTWDTPANPRPSSIVRSSSSLPNLRLRDRPRSAGRGEAGSTRSKLNGFLRIREARSFFDSLRGSRVGSEGCKTTESFPST